MNEWKVLLMVAGGWGWAMCAFQFFLRSFPRRDTFDSRQALRWGGAAILSFAIWVVGMLTG